MRPPLGRVVRTDVLLARYGEIGLKSRPVRRRFEQALQENIERAFEQDGADVVVTRIPGRFLITSSEATRATAILTRIFGLTSVSPARLVASDLPTLLAEIPKFFDELAALKPTARSLALRVRRNGQHPYTSQDLARQGGSSILSRPGFESWKVDLENPDIEVSIEVRDRQAFLFAAKHDAPGGLPVGTQGRVVVLLKDLNSAVAAWLMMKRGCTILPMTFLGPTGQAEHARRFIEVLRGWYFRGELAEFSHQEAAEFPQKESCVLCMRQMTRKADLYARRKKARAIVTGEAFSSSTVENLTQFGAVARVPILRPVLGMAPHIANEFAQKMGVEVGRGARFYEPCPLRVFGRVDERRVPALEAELGLEVRAFEAVRGVAPAASVRP